MNLRKNFIIAILLCPILLTLGSFKATFAQGIEQLLLERVPVPTPRPSSVSQVVQVSVTSSVASTASIASIPVSSGKITKVTAQSGSLKSGLDALSNKDTVTALSIRAGMTPNSLDHKILSWAIALSSQEGIYSGDITSVARALPDWPGQTAMRRNAEEALSREGLSSNAIINAFNGRKPESVTGAILLARAYLETGNSRKANAAIAPIWRTETLDQNDEKRILSQVGRALSKADHRFRMHWMFYRERTKAANRISKYAEQASLAKARTAVAKKAKNAGKLLAAVAPSSKRDAGYTFARIQHARRSDDYHKAAQLMLKAPRDRTVLVHPDEWWVERRIISRHLLDLGDAKTAYKIAAGHSAESPAKIAEAEFHAGWYALRYLKDSNAAKRHFSNILLVSNKPISQARGHYWLGRASSGTKATNHFQQAAQHTGTFYGQLAAAKLGKRRLGIVNPKPSTLERGQFAKRELVRAIKKLEAADHAWRTNIIYRHLAKTLSSPGELAMLSARAEKNGNASLALQIGKIAYARGISVDTLSWPIGAIPKSAKIGNTGRALAYAIARQESAFNPKAVSPANARGLLQLLPGTAKLVAKKQGLKYSYKRLTSDPAYNATLGAAYLSDQLDTFDNSYILTFAGYNAGPSRAKEWLERYGDPRGKGIEHVVDWIERIPFTETRNYVQRVMENYQIYKARLQGGRFDIASDLIHGRR